jgi:hypothetical protein
MVLFSVRIVSNRLLSQDADARIDGLMYELVIYSFLLRLDFYGRCTLGIYMIYTKAYGRIRILEFSALTAQ